MVVTPTRKAAQVAGRQLGTWGFSAAWLAHQHGWRWDANGTWTRLDTGQIDPGSRHPGRQYVGPNTRRYCGPVTFCWWTRPGCSSRTPLAPLLHVTDDAGHGWCWWGTGTSFQLSAGEVCSISRHASLPPARARSWRRFTGSLTPTTRR